MNRYLSAEFWLVLNAIWVAPVTAKLSSKTVISKKLKTRRKRNKSNSSDMDSETDQKSQRLFDKKLLGLSSPQALLNTVWLNNMIHFGLRGCKEQKELRWGDIILKTDSDGKEYRVLWTPNKTGTGEDPRNQRPIKPRIYANNDAISIDRDPVHVYKMYKEKRPPSMLEPDSSFYLSVHYFKTETHSSVEGKNWVQSTTNGSEQVKQYHERHDTSGGNSRKNKPQW